MELADYYERASATVDKEKAREKGIARIIIASAAIGYAGVALAWGAGYIWFGVFLLTFIGLGQVAVHLATRGRVIAEFHRAETAKAEAAYWQDAHYEMIRGQHEPVMGE